MSSKTLPPARILSFSSVYEGQDLEQNRHVAVKIIHAVAYKRTALAVLQKSVIVAKVRLLKLSNGIFSYHDRENFPERTILGTEHCDLSALVGKPEPNPLTHFSAISGGLLTRTRRKLLQLFKKAYR